VIFNLTKLSLKINPKGLVQVARALVLVTFPSGLSLRFESPWVQPIPWGRLVGESGILSNLCEGNALYGSEVYPVEVGTRSYPALEGFFFIKKKKSLKIMNLVQPLGFMGSGWVEV
jgi:hypothetical protein